MSGESVSPWQYEAAALQRRKKSEGFIAVTLILFTAVPILLAAFDKWVAALLALAIWAYLVWGFWLIVRETDIQFKTLMSETKSLAQARGREGADG